MATNEEQTAIDGVREALNAATANAKALPKGRAASLVLTKLDEARLWLEEVRAGR